MTRRNWPVQRRCSAGPSTRANDARNNDDKIAARQELDLRPQLERLDRLMLRSERLDPAALTFSFRPLWQLDAASAATIALTRAQATQVYAGLKLWPAAVTARLVEAQLVEDGTYPNAAAVFAKAGTTASIEKMQAALDFSTTQPRDLWGRWTSGIESSPGAVLAASSFQSAPTANSASFQKPDGTSVLRAFTGFSGSKTGSHAPDGTPITLAASADDPQGLKIAKAAATAAGLNRPQRRIFHDAITGQGITDYQELLSIALGVKRGEYP